MRMSDWSSDVCSSYLIILVLEHGTVDARLRLQSGPDEVVLIGLVAIRRDIPLADRVLAVIVTAPRQRQIGDRLVGGLGIREWQAADPRLAARCFNDIAVRIEFRLALVLQRSFEEAHRIEQGRVGHGRSEEHTSELQSLMRISYA